MYEISKEAKRNQLKLMCQLLSLKGSLLTKDQKQVILARTDKEGILEGFKLMDKWEESNKRIKQS